MVVVGKEEFPVFTVGYDIAENAEFWSESELCSDFIRATCSSLVSTVERTQLLNLL